MAQRTQCVSNPVNAVQGNNSFFLNIIPNMITICGQNKKFMIDKRKEVRTYLRGLVVVILFLYLSAWQQRVAYKRRELKYCSNKFRLEAGYGSTCKGTHVAVAVCYVCSPVVLISYWPAVRKLQDVTLRIKQGYWVLVNWNNSIVVKVWRMPSLRVQEAASTYGRHAFSKLSLRFHHCLRR